MACTGRTEHFHSAASLAAQKDKASELRLQGKQAVVSKHLGSVLFCKDAMGGEHCLPCVTGAGCEHPVSHCMSSGTSLLMWLHRQSSKPKQSQRQGSASKHAQYVPKLGEVKNPSHRVSGTRCVSHKPQPEQLSLGVLAKFDLLLLWLSLLFFS